MLDESRPLKPNQRKDIAERCLRFLAEHKDVNQATLGRDIGLKSSSVSELLRLKYTVATADKYLAKIHNWMELAARRDSIVRSREFVETEVAAEILMVANVVAETCKIGVVFGPAQIGKTFTLRAIEGQHRFGDPVLIAINEATTRPFAVCRALCRTFDLSVSGTFDAVFQRLVQRLQGTKRMLMFDEADLASYPALECIRQLHDATGCPVLFAGKPKIYEHLGFRRLADFDERLDQMVGRIVIKRDLTERTRGKNPKPLYSLSDIRKLIAQSGLTLKVTPDAEKWMRDRASSLGTGGIGMTMAVLYLASKIAFTRGDATITADHLETASCVTMGEEDAARVAEIVQESSGMRRVV